MKLLFYITCFLLGYISQATANGIDDNCPSLTYRKAPAVKADQYICHKMYAIAYSYTTKNPIYTTEYLLASHTGDEARTNNFRVDPAIPKQYQSRPSDYDRSGTTCGSLTATKRTSSCDQGHMTPDQDFSADAAGVSESFFMSNMVPQNFKNNEVIWKGMEIMLRKYVMRHQQGVYIITGPIYNSSTPNVLGKNKVWIPDMLFKIAIDVQTGHSIAFLLPNKAIQIADLPKYVTNLTTIENKTGIRFDSSVNKLLTATYQDWTN